LGEGGKDNHVPGEKKKGRGGVVVPKATRGETGDCSLKVSQGDKGGKARKPRVQEGIGRPEREEEEKPEPISIKRVGR